MGSLVVWGESRLVSHQIQVSNCHLGIFNFANNTWVEKEAGFIDGSAHHRGITCITIKTATMIIRAMITMSSVLYLLALGLSLSSGILNLLVGITPTLFKSEYDAKK